MERAARSEHSTPSQQEACSPVPGMSSLPLAVAVTPARPTGATEASGPTGGEREDKGGEYQTGEGGEEEEQGEEEEEEDGYNPRLGCQPGPSLAPLYAATVRKNRKHGKCDSHETGGGYAVIIRITAWVLTFHTACHLRLGAATRGPGRGRGRGCRAWPHMAARRRARRRPVADNLVEPTRA